MLGAIEEKQYETRMMINLTSEEFKRTMNGKMNNITATGEAIVDIWPYVAELNREKVVLDYVLENQLVEAVYRNITNTFHHVLLPTERPNIFVAIIVNISKRNIEGYYRLDLKKEYGLE